METREILENIFKSVDILVKKQISKSKLDKTVKGMIVDINEENYGEYVVQTGNAKIKAYSDGSVYSLSAIVYVLIPEGNYDNTKFIIGEERLG